MIPENFSEVLKKVVRQLEGQGISWAVTGSVGFALQGLPVTPNDIDLQSDWQGAYEMEQIFCDHVTRSVSPKTSERMRLVTGVFELDGVQVEIIGAIQKRLPDGGWEEPVNVDDYKHFISIDSLQVPVLDLQYEQEAYLKLGRMETAALLADWLKNHKDN
ncbi:MAG: hypothetical protein FVQ83_02950 [Chloroflexi bacterium]|nr:hypothetical protein [Chloroflexota bacterium]